MFAPEAQDHLAHLEKTDLFARLRLWCKAEYLYEMPPLGAWEIFRVRDVVGQYGHLYVNKKGRLSFAGLLAPFEGTMPRSKINVKSLQDLSLQG